MRYKISRRLWIATSSVWKRSLITAIEAIRNGVKDEGKVMRDKTAAANEAAIDLAFSNSD